MSSLMLLTLIALAVSYINPYSNIEERNAYHAQALCPSSSSSWNSDQSSSCGCISCSVVRNGSLSLYPTTCCSFTLTNHCFPISTSSMIFSGVRSEAEQREQISLILFQTSSAVIVAASVTLFVNVEAQVDYVVGTVQYQTHRRSSVLRPSVQVFSTETFCDAIAATASRLNPTLTNHGCWSIIAVLSAHYQRSFLVFEAEAETREHVCSWIYCKHPVLPCLPPLPTLGLKLIL